MFAAFKRAKLLKIDSVGDSMAAVGQEAVSHYLQNIARMDDRRIRWIVERAAENTAEQMDKLEGELVVLNHFKRDDEAQEKREEIRRLEEDFRFLYGLERILNAQSIDKFTNNMVEHIRTVKQVPPVRMKKNNDPK